MQDLSWFPFSVAATLLFGISMAFYKLPSVKSQKRYAVSFWQLFFCFLLSVMFFLRDLINVDLDTVLYGFLWGASFFVLSVTQMKALKTIETNTLYPITTSMSLVATVLFGILFFKDVISLWQVLGILLVVTIVLLFSYAGGRLKFSKEIAWIGLTIISLSAFGKIIQKFAADNVDIHTLQIFQYLFAMLFALVISSYSFSPDF